MHSTSRGLKQSHKKGKTDFVFYALTQNIHVHYNVHIMDIKRTLSISEARKKIFEIAEDVQKPSTHYTLTEKGRPKAVLMSADEFESWRETIAVMHHFPDLKNDLKETDDDVRSGGYKNYMTLDEILNKRGYMVADRPQKKYAVRSTAKTKGGKRPRKAA